MTSTVTTRKSPWKKIALTGAVLIGAGALVGAGAFAVFTDSDTADVAVDAGQLDIDIATGNYVIADIAPGDTVQRLLTINLANATNDGNLVQTVRFASAVSGETLGTNATTGVANTGASLVAGADGLNYTLRTCSVAWTPSAASPVGPYTCSGVETVTDTTKKLSALGTTPASYTPANFGVTPDAATGTFPSDAGDVQLYSLVELALPTTADNNYENAAATITFTASAIQRAGIQK